MIAWFFVWGSPEFVAIAIVAFCVLSALGWIFRRIDEDRVAVLATRPPKPCRRCGKEVSLTVTHCPHCGIREPTAMEISHRTGILIIAGVFGIPLLLSLLAIGIASLFGNSN